jgi:oxygen-independent coproporphyrinogen-3 oxidase
LTLANMSAKYSLYLHIPFCTHRCAYCDFNTYAGQERLIPAYVEALCEEIRIVAANAGERLPVHTIFFGGGTPSLLTPKQFERILLTIEEFFELSDLESSMEANPGTVTPASLLGLRRAGINRISFGVQSFNSLELRQLERIHDPFDVLEAVRWARQAGFNNLNLDLIYGLPNQPLSSWQESLQRAVALNPEHLSLYALTIEHGTPYGRWAKRGLLSIPDPDLAADMYEYASEFLEGQGYQQYEISNWSKPGFQCRHNLQYWRNLPYLGFGAGAHGCSNETRISNALHINTYLDHILNPSTISSHSTPRHNGSLGLPFPISPATVTQVRLTPFVEMQETMMLGLRLTHEGISPATFQARFGQELLTVFGKEIDELVHLVLVEFKNSPAPFGQGELLRLTRRGRLLGNQVFLRFVG